MTEKPPSPIRIIARFLRRPQFRSNVLHERARRRHGLPVLPSEPVKTALVICHGNICRSPFAERLLAKQRPDLIVRSAGLHAGDGNCAEPGAMAAAKDYEIDLSDHSSTPMSDANVAWADVIIGMEGHHLAQIARRFPTVRPRSYALGDFLESPPYTIDDPWGEEDEIFRANFSKIARSVDRFVESLNVRNEA